MKSLSQEVMWKHFITGLSGNSQRSMVALCQTVRLIRSQPTQRMGQMPDSESDQLTMETRLWEALQATAVFLIPAAMISVRKRKAYVYEIFLWSPSTRILLQRRAADGWSEVFWSVICSDKGKTWMLTTAKNSAPGEYHFQWSSFKNQLIWITAIS